MNLQYDTPTTQEKKKEKTKEKNARREEDKIYSENESGFAYLKNITKGIKL